MCKLIKRRLLRDCKGMDQVNFEITAKLVKHEKNQALSKSSNNILEYVNGI